MNVEDMDILIKAIEKRNCILMLGPETVTEELAGKPRSLPDVLASSLADKLNINTPEIDRYNLPMMSQLYCFCCNKGQTDLENEFVSFYKKRQNQTSELYENLSALPFHLIVSSAHDDQMCNALMKDGLQKTPQAKWYNFHKSVEKNIGLKDVTDKNPIIYSLYGSTQDSESLVITQDNLIDFLSAVKGNKPAIPYDLLKELQDENKIFLFLGFGFKHWYFRILLHALKKVDRKRNRSFALEEFVNTCDLNTISFLYQHGHKIEFLINKDLNKFAKDLRERYEETSKQSLQLKPKECLKPKPSAIFLCHAHEDKEKALRLFKLLKEAGHEPWIDKEGLYVGDAWDNVIVNKIKEANYFIIVGSKALEFKIYEDHYVNKEIKLAEKRQQSFYKTNFIMPIFIEKCDELPKDLSPFGEFQYVDLTDKALSEVKDIEPLTIAISRDQQLRARNKQP